MGNFNYVDKGWKNYFHSICVDFHFHTQLKGCLSISTDYYMLCFTQSGTLSLVLWLEIKLTLLVYYKHILK